MVNENNFIISESANYFTFNEKWMRCREDAAVKKQNKELLDWNWTSI